MPRADDLRDMVIESNPVPTKLNPLGAKGAGEAGTVGALPAVINAVIDALAPLGVEQLDMPATSERVWQAIRSARAGLGRARRPRSGSGRRAPARWSRCGRRDRRCPSGGGRGPRGSSSSSATRPRPRSGGSAAGPRHGCSPDRVLPLTFLGAGDRTVSSASSSERRSFAVTNGGQAEHEEIRDLVRQSLRLLGGRRVPSACRRPAARRGRAR